MLNYLYALNVRCFFFPVFHQAADKTANPSYAFGTVDCLYDFALCEQQNIKSSPALKLFSNGFDLSTLNDPGKFTSDQLRMLMKMTPILTQPRVEVGKEFLAQATEKPKKKRRLCFWNALAENILVFACSSLRGNSLKETILAEIMFAIFPRRS